ncbi:unnamed protein product, partial [marine sediment metagenome]
VSGISYENIDILSPLNSSRLLTHVFFTNKYNPE